MGWGWGSRLGRILVLLVATTMQVRRKNIKHCHHQSPFLLAINNIITLDVNTIFFLPPSCHNGYDCLNLAVKQVTIRSKPLTTLSLTFTPIKFGIHPVFILWYGCQDRLLILLHTFVPLNFSQHQLAKCEVCLVSWECAPLSILLHCAVCSVPILVNSLWNPSSSLAMLALHRYALSYLLTEYMVHACPMYYSLINSL